MSMPLAKYYTADDVRASPDDGIRYETVHGELLMTPAPGGRHPTLNADCTVDLARLFAEK